MFNPFKQKDQVQSDQRHRVPPGQYVTDKFPVLHYGSVPKYTNVEEQWDLRCWGELAEPIRFSFREFRALPTTTIKTDIHCVTRWSKLDTVWEGVSFREFLRHIPPLKPSARFVIAHSEQGYTANLPLDVLLNDDVLLAYKYDGQELTPEHGYPLRLLVPKKYFWKSAKWLRGIEFLDHDRLGFWERYGYNNNADPWREERYADD
ncbi:sulfite oxidase-like oxidoreductase [Chloroflexus sp. MS-CIW-1]|jgi:DMSO/TMAO reductase YedYZ molybdopterin-dependent catalytic subunit|uniref:sulfite oxidase-like oxidoreductase n=1 Tax=Chloroflexus sp. MS-CIW-1 TaxID=3055768 RepID=UPI002647B8F0|nr:sulfite oxidase-like oxidoreductase [Chloroflexus sp. MS-CIW-1]MDN5273746.1 sulfite oxidase-like oxidoreductase [Chloroflexus sp. MS-CIW-1]